MSLKMHYAAKKMCLKELKYMIIACNISNAFLILYKIEEKRGKYLVKRFKEQINIYCEDICLKTIFVAYIYQYKVILDKK